MKSPRAALLIVMISLPALAAGPMRGDHYSLDELIAAIRRVAEISPQLATITEFGKSVEGRPMLALRVARPDGKKRGRALITAGIHAEEFMSSRVALAMAERLVRDHGHDRFISALLDDIEFHFIPLMNPDGYATAARHLEMGYTMARDNANKVDLNRNWPYPRAAVASDFRSGSDFKLHPNYRGPYPLSEPETQALQRYVHERAFFTAINIHTTGAHFTYPWSYKPDPPAHREAFLAMGQALTLHQGYCRYTVHQSHDWYQIVGSLNDWLYGRYGALSVTVEVAKIRLADIRPPWRAFNTFWWYNPVDIDKWIDNDADAILHAILAAHRATGGNPVPRQDSDIEWVTGNE